MELPKGRDRAKVLEGRAEQDFFGFIPFWVGWEIVFFLRERFFSRVSAKKLFGVFLVFFFGVFGVLGGVFVLWGVLFLFFAS